MTKQYVGHLSSEDPLYNYLQYDIMPQMGGTSDQARYRVFRLGGTNNVYLYEEKYSGKQVVGKFFMAKYAPDTGRPPHWAEKEFNNLNLARGYGLTTMPHYVVRPLGYNPWLSDVLMVEYRGGELLSNIINTAIHCGASERLFRKLTALAYFLATLHNHTANGVPVNFNEDCAYLDRILARLYNSHMIRWDDVSEFYWLRDRWREQPRMWEDQQVLVHGDATPANFLFGKGLDVIAIDMEKMKRTDRAFDAGRITGELQHFFMLATGNKYAAEPFIGHFLWEYSCHFPDRDSAFRSVTRRIPFHMGLTLLRIARNHWVSHDYRSRLINEAKITLRAF